MEADELRVHAVSTPNRVTYVPDGGEGFSIPQDVATALKWCDDAEVGRIAAAAVAELRARGLGPRATFDLAARAAELEETARRAELLGVTRQAERDRAVAAELRRLAEPR